MERTCLKIIAFVIFVLIMSTARTQGAPLGISLITGSTQVANGDFYAAINGGTGSPKSAMLFGAGLYLGNSNLEIGFYWYTFSLQSRGAGNNTLHGSSNQFMIDFAIRPLNLGTLSGLAVMAGFGMGIGYADATLDTKEYNGYFYQPEITFKIPLSSSDEGYSSGGEFYPNMIFSLDIRVGFRSSTLSLFSPDYYPNGPPQIDLGGGYISIGLAIQLQKL